MLDLVKRNIHMNRWKNQVNTQVTLDDDFIVPDTMSDVAQVILDSGQVELEPARVQSGRVFVGGKLDFNVLYRREEGGLQTLGGMIPFEETVNVPELDEGDYVSVGWRLEDLETAVINSRKLSIRAVVTLEIKVEALFDAEAAVGLGEHLGSDTGARIEVQKEQLEVAAIAARKKDTYRLKEQLAISGSRPAIDRILWTQMRLGSTQTRPLNGSIHLEGILSVFVIYEGEGEEGSIQWLEESLPFSGEVEMQGALEEMIPVIELHLVHRGLEEKPDADGEMRQLEVDAVIELDIRLYQEQRLELLKDLYAVNRELTMETETVCFDQILLRSTGACRIGDKVELPGNRRVLQICHCSGTVKLDEVEARAEALAMDGALEVRLLYLTDDDAGPIQSVTRLLPFHYEAEVPGIDENSIWYLETRVEQLTSVMAGGGQVEVKASAMLELLVLRPVCRSVIRQVEAAPLDRKAFQQQPGIVGYLVQSGDTLWSIARRFRTTVDAVMQVNSLSSEEIKPGDCLIVVKEMLREPGTI